jgi:hypothetical protein
MIYMSEEVISPVQVLKRWMLDHAAADPTGTEWCFM